MAKCPDRSCVTRKARKSKFRLVNKLDQPTSLNWHGVRIVNAMDGVGGLTQEPVPPGGSFDYRFTPPDSGLFWYHPHVLPFTREQHGRGLYGVMIVDEPEPPQADRDMLVVLDDWKLDGKGQIADFDAAQDAGRIGSLVTVNSRAVPVDGNAAAVLAAAAAHRERRRCAVYGDRFQRGHAFDPRGR